MNRERVFKSSWRNDLIDFCNTAHYKHPDVYSYSIPRQRSLSPISARPYY